MAKDYIGTSLEIVELLEKATFATVLKLSDDALTSEDAAVADLARQVTQLALPTLASVMRTVVHVSTPKGAKEPEMMVLVALQKWLDEHIPTAENSILICSEEAAETGKISAIDILLTSEKHQFPVVTPVTTQFSVHDEIGARLQELWRKTEYQNWSDLAWVKHPPLYPTSLTTNGALVLGINPSLNIDDLKLLHYEARREVDSSYFGRIAGFMQNIENMHQRLQNELNESEDITFTPVPWSHLDMLYVRETNQARFREEMGREGVASFLWEQTQITKTLLQKAQPRLIVVANAFARELLGKNVDSKTKERTWMGLKFTAEPDLRTGTYHCESLPGSPPVFFTNSLAGSSPRDKAADERLTWQIARCLLLQQNSSNWLSII